MAGIFEEVRMRENAYANNPQALQQRYAQTQELVDLLALQQVNNEKRAAANQIQASMQTVPDTVRDQLEQEALMSSRNQLLAQIGPGVQQQGQRSMMAQQRQPMRQPMQGVAGMPANNMMKAAQGGIVGYAEGGATQDSNSEEAQRQRYLQLKAAEAQAIQTDNQLALQNIRRELRNYEGSTAAQAPAPTPENTDGMAGGGIVSFVKGGKAGFPDLNNDGKVTYGDVLKGRGVEGKFDGGQIREALGGLLTLATRTPFTKDGERSNFGKILGRLFGLPDVPIDFGRTSDDARRYNMDVMEALTERDIGGREEIEEEVMETMSVPTRAEAFGTMFPRAQEAVDEYARNKEMGGIGALRTAGRMQEQRRDRNQAMQNFFGDLASQQAQARQDKARMAAQFLLNENKFKKRPYELDPAMTLEGIEEVGIEGFDRGGIVGFDGTNGSSVEDRSLRERIYEATKDAEVLGIPLFPDFGDLTRDTMEFIDENPVEAGLTALSLIPAGRAVNTVGSAAVNAAKPLVSKYGPRAMDFLRKAYTKPGNYRPAQPGKNLSPVSQGKGFTMRNPLGQRLEQSRVFDLDRLLTTLGVGSGIGLGIGALSGGDDDRTTPQPGPNTGPPTRAEEFARMFPDARKGVEEFAKKKRLAALQDEQTERDNIAGTKRLRNIATFLRGMGSGSSTAESLQKGGDALEAAIVAEEKQQAALLNAQLDRMGKMAVAQLAAKVDREKILADFEGKITAAEMNIAQDTLKDLSTDARFLAAAEDIRDQDLDPLEEQVRLQNLTAQIVGDSVASARSGIYRNNDVNNPLDLGLE
tara:strand:+ start:869 stop:3298 length:2430 start_codon:yes stop_codon:yes gene_type:complete